MDFPVYVPAGAREHIRWTLCGDGIRWRGVNSFVAEYREGNASHDVLASVEDEQACLLRFAHDTRMRDVYAELQKVFTSDDQYADFLRSAYAADVDFARYRERVKQAKSLAPKIAEAAAALAGLLKQAGDVGGGTAPSEFYSIRTLLDATDNHELDDHNLHMWRAVRGAVTGSRPECETADAATDSAASSQQVVFATEENAEQVKRDNPDERVIVIKPVSSSDAVEQDPEEKARNFLRYAWEKAPLLPALLETVVHAAESWMPQEYGAIGAAISTRQRNQVTEYVRAFAELLRQDMPSLELSAPIHAAMAGIADVVLNDANNVVTADAVRKALIRAVDNST